MKLCKQIRLDISIVRLDRHEIINIYGGQGREACRGY